MKLWEEEFGPEYDIPDLIQDLVAEGVLEDISWHNDSVPSFALVDPRNQNYGIRVWVDHPIRSKRESEGPRYGVQLGRLDREGEGLATIDLEEALAKIFEMAKSRRFTGTTIRKQSWWDDRLEPSELVVAFLKTRGRESRRFSRKSGNDRKKTEHEES